MNEIEPHGIFDIKWNDKILPLNYELWDEWSLSKLKIFEYPEITIPVRVMYIPDDEFDKWTKHTIGVGKPSWKTFWKYPKWWWQYNRTRAVSYAGRIYIKESSKDDRVLLLHELAHTVPLLKHSHILKPGLMNPMSKMWLVNKTRVR